MAKRIKVKKTETPKGANFFVISIEKKKKILGVFLALFAVLVFLSILSYSKSDSALDYRFTDLFKVFSNNPEFIHKISTTENWLGIFGAYISHFFVSATLGYFSIVFPLISFIWGYTVIKNENKKLSIYVTNFLIAVGIIFSTFFGLLNSEFDVLVDAHQLYGKIGLFFGQGIGRLLGGLGGIIFLSTIFLVVLIISFDIKFSSIVNYVKQFMIEAFKSSDEESEEVTEDKTTINIKKIKKLKEKKPVDQDTVEETEDDEQQQTKETKIRILRNEKKSKDEQPEEKKKLKVRETSNSPKNTSKVIDDSADAKEDDTIIPAIDKDKEQELPDQWDEKIDYTPPYLDHLETNTDKIVQISEHELKRNAELLKEKLALFDIEIEDISVTPGPVVTLYEIVPAPGVKISRIVSLEHDIALALAARGIRIIAPIPGKSAIGVEIPNAEATLVTARDVISKLKESKAELPLALGKTINGDIYITDLAKMPHLLIAGSTGAGKSVGINMMINSILYSKHPSEVKFVIVDPKKIELSFYRKLNKHFLAVSPDLDEEVITIASNALLVLKAVEYEMEKRYDKLAKAGVRNIIDYNKKIADPKKRPSNTDIMQHFKLPYIVVIIDELADLMITSSREVEEPISRLAQLARAVGIHLIVATQRPSVNVITGVIKANFSARIAYQVATKIDSRTILDMNGAEQLLGRGDMLFLPGGMPKPVRIQNAFITTEEVEKITNHIYVQQGYSKRYFLPSMVEKKMSAEGGFLNDLDPMFEEAAKVIVRHQQGSVSLLQRRLKLGYSRAARIVDQLEEAGIVGPSEGSKAREVLVESDELLETILRSL